MPRSRLEEHLEAITRDFVRQIVSALQPGTQAGLRICGFSNLIQ